MSFVKLPVSDLIVNLKRIAYITEERDLNEHKHLPPRIRHSVIFFNHNPMGTKNIHVEREDYEFIVSKLKILE